MRKYLGDVNYDNKCEEFNTLYAAEIDSYRKIDNAYEKVENLARLQRELTKNDFDGFVNLLKDSNMPNDEIYKIASEFIVVLRQYTDLS